MAINTLSLFISASTQPWKRWQPKHHWCSFLSSSVGLVFVYSSFCHGLTVWTICFVDIAVSYDYLCCCAANQFFSLFITLYCLPLTLVNKVDQKFQTHPRIVRFHAAMVDCPRICAALASNCWVTMPLWCQMPHAAAAAADAKWSDNISSASDAGDAKMMRHAPQPCRWGPHRTQWTGPARLGGHGRLGCGSR